MDIGYERTISRDAEDVDIMVEGNNAALRALEELSFTCKIWRMASRFGGSNILPKHFSAKLDAAPRLAVSREIYGPRDCRLTAF